MGIEKKLAKQFKQQAKVLLEQEPWASILDFAEKNSETLKVKLKTLDLTKGTATMKITNKETGSRLYIKSDLTQGDSPIASGPNGRNKVPEQQYNLWYTTIDKKGDSSIGLIRDETTLAAIAHIDQLVLPSNTSTNPSSNLTTKKLHANL